MILNPSARLIPPYVVDRIRRRPPADCCVLPGSTPVVAFGDPSQSLVATLGLNPSRVEFEAKGVEFDGQLRRFETLRSLGVEQMDGASHDAVARVWTRCNAYFHGNPYRWFDYLEQLVNAVDASYFGDTACHLDLSQWATDPTWSGLPQRARERLVADDSGFLQEQLRSEPIRLLLLNGRSVLTAAQKGLGIRLRQEPETVSDRSVVAQIYTSQTQHVQVVGWSTNLQSSRGVTRVFRARLAERVRLLRDRA